jgi:hypothetical protein
MQPVSGQLFGKWVPVATDTHATSEVLLDCINGNGVSYVVRAEMLQARSIEFRGMKLSSVHLSELT